MPFGTHSIVFLFFFISKDGWIQAQLLTLSGPKSVENVEWNNKTLSLLLLSYVIPIWCKKGNNNEAHLLITESKATELIFQLSCSALLTAEVWRKGHCHNTQLLFPVWVIEKCCRVLGYHAGVKIKACRPTRPVEVAARGRHDGEEWWGVKAETGLAPLAEVTQDCQCSRNVTLCSAGEGVKRCADTLSQIQSRKKVLLVCVFSFPMMCNF